jgi:hypothetical protein
MAGRSEIGQKSAHGRNTMKFFPVPEFGNQLPKLSDTGWNPIRKGW